MIEHCRILLWEGSSRKDFKAFPIEVQKDMGVALFVVQMGGWPTSAKPWKGLGPGVHELREEYFGNAFRAVYTLQAGGAVHVLHAFQKKAKSRLATPKTDVDLVGKRLKALLGRCEAGRGGCV